MARILLAGCGAIGTQLGLQLAANGHQVFGLRRSDKPLPFAAIQCDLTRSIAVGTLPAALDYVVHTGTPAERSDAGYAAAYPQAVTHLLQALQGQSLKRFFFVSSTAVYQQDDGSLVDEASVTAPQQFNGSRVLQAEHILAQATIPYTCVRFGGIYGRGRNWLLRRVQSGVEAQASPPKYTNRIHQDDCVGVLQFLIEQSEQGKPVRDLYVAVDDEPADEASVYSWLAQQLHAPAPLLRNEPASASRNKRCSNQRLRDAGYQFIYPSFREGYGAAIAEAGSQFS